MSNLFKQYTFNTNGYTDDKIGVGRGNALPFNFRETRIITDKILIAQMKARSQ